jgi:hypothetical protein
MKCALEIGSVTMIFTLSFIKTSSGIQKLQGVGNTDTQTEWR